MKQQTLNGGSLGPDPLMNPLRVRLRARAQRTGRTLAAIVGAVMLTATKPKDIRGKLSLE